MVAAWRLTVTGAVERELDLTAAELGALPRRDLAIERQHAGGEPPTFSRWGGADAAELIARAAPAASARFLLAASDDYAVLLGLERLRGGRAVVATEHDGSALEAPRLVVDAGTFCQNVKDVRRLTLVADAGGSPFADAADWLHGAEVDEERLAAVWDELDGRLPRESGGGSATAGAAADMLMHLLQGKLSAQQTQGRLYRERLAPLAAELHSLLAVKGGPERRHAWQEMVRRCARVYADPELPDRYRLLAQQWARMAAGAAHKETGAILVPPALSGEPGGPFWLEA